MRHVAIMPIGNKQNIGTCTGEYVCPAIFTCAYTVEGRHLVATSGVQLKPLHALLKPYRYGDGVTLVLGPAQSIPRMLLRRRITSHRG